MERARNAEMNETDNKQEVIDILTNEKEKTKEAHKKKVQPDSHWDKSRDYLSNSTDSTESRQYTSSPPRYRKPTRRSRHRSRSNNREEYRCARANKSNETQPRLNKKADKLELKVWETGGIPSEFKI